jgi:hypothetical protein
MNGAAAEAVTPLPRPAESFGYRSRIHLAVRLCEVALFFEVVQITWFRLRKKFSQVARVCLSLDAISNACEKEVKPLLLLGRVYAPQGLRHGFDEAICKKRINYIGNYCVECCVIHRYALHSGANGTSSSSIGAALPTSPPHDAHPTILKDGFATSP